MVLVTATLLAPHLGPPLLGADSAGRPNIVYIMADDLGWSDVGYNGAKFYETPNIDALCRSGMEFTSAYPGAANCMPSRACIMSGMYVTRTQMWTPGMRAKGESEKMKFLVPRNRDKKGDGVFPSKGGLSPGVTSIAEVLKDAGYKTAHFGKWHLGPNGQGFDVNDTNGLGAGLGQKFYGDINVAEKLTDAACDFIDKNRSNPFFIYLSHWDVHSPFRARKEVVAKYKEKLESRDWDRNWNPTYAAMIEAVDTSVGRIREKLQRHGLTENTLVMFTSDNGGASGITWCAPLKGAKGAFYEGGIRVPACVSWPGVVEPGSSCDTPITGVDLMPTFAELAGATLPSDQSVDGRSWVPLLSGRSLPERAIFWHYPLYLSGAGYNKVVPVFGTDQMYWRATPCSVIRRGDWKLIQFFEDDSAELYNLRSDLGEQNDLSKSHPEKTAQLLDQLRQWQKDTQAVIPTRLNPDFGKPASGKRAAANKKR
ncbi:sulfatase [Rhodopirellula sp. JC639]|uniref:sulfatase n=1 Tax=Stieleria mannarensis TaxID=2755585 RepID=UPI0016047A8E